MNRFNYKTKKEKKETEIWNLAEKLYIESIFNNEKNMTSIDKVSYCYQLAKIFVDKKEEMLKEKK